MPTLIAFLLLSVSLATATAASLPVSLVVLPLSSFTNSTLVAAYACTPTYSPSVCSGHGDCYLLIDSTANASQPLLNGSTAQPLPAVLSGLDPHGIDSSTPLPAAVCICHSGYTGRGDYIRHNALDGDGCGIDERVTAGLCITGTVLFCLLLLPLALHRLSRWLSWYRQHVDGDTATILSSQLSSDETDDVTKSRLQQRSQRSRTADGAPTSPVRLVSPKGAASPTGGRGNAFQYNNINIKSPTAAGKLTSAKATGSGVAAIRPSVYQRQNAGSGSSNRWAAFSHLSFCHPLCSIVLATATAAFYLVRLTTDLTLGESLGMSALCYVSHHGYYIGSCIATYHTLRLAATITRTQTGAGGLSAVMRRVKVCMFSLVGYSLVAWLLLFLLPSFPQAQQTTSILVLTVLHLPVWALALLSLTATRRITSALVQHLDKLSAQQREARTAVCRKLRSQSNVVLVMVLLNVGVCLMLAVSGWLRQAGQPYFHLFTHYFCWLTLFIRLLLIQPPGRTAAAVVPHSPLPPPTANVVPKPPHVHSPSQTVLPTTALLGQGRHMRLASAVSSNGQPSNVSSRRATDEEQRRVGKESAEVTRTVASADGGGAGSVDVQTATKPRLSIVTDVD